MNGKTAAIASGLGYARTDLISNRPGANGALWQLNRTLRPLISHSAAAAA